MEVARESGFIFKQISQLTVDFYCNLRYINLTYFVKSHLRSIYRKFFRTISQDSENAKKIDTLT